MFGLAAWHHLAKGTRCYYIKKKSLISHLGGEGGKKAKVKPFIGRRRNGAQRHSVIWQRRYRGGEGIVGSGRGLIECERPLKYGKDTEGRIDEMVVLLFYPFVSTKE